MPQTVSAAYQQLDASPSKRPDFVFVVGGWPTIYTVADDSYAIGSGAHALSSTNGFTTVRKWSDAPEISPSKMKGAFPEAGGYDIGDLVVELIDKHGVSTVTRDLSDFLSRQAYVEGNRTAAEYRLSSTITTTKAATDIVLQSTAGIVAGDVLHISQESILVGSVNGDGITLNGCTRGYLLTNASQHEVSVKVYSYIPNLTGRPCWVYKGYRDLPLSSWVKAWGGIITNASRGRPGKVVIQARATTWVMWGGSAPGGRFHSGQLAPTFASGRPASSPASGGVRRLVRLGNISNDVDSLDLGGLSYDNVMAGDFQFSFETMLEAPTGLGDGHFMVKSSGGNEWCGIAAGLRFEFTPGNAGWASRVGVWLIRGFSHATLARPFEFNASLDFGWSNCVFARETKPTMSDPIELMLQFLTSTGSGTNGDYDDFKKGVGLGIPVEQIDVDSFTAVMDQYDYDLNRLKVAFIFSESVPAKDFIEQELCRPFGWYLGVANDGRIKLVRPKNPDKLYFSRANNVFQFYANNDSSTRKEFVLPSGVYTPEEAAAALQSGFRAASGLSTMTVTASLTAGSGWKFDINLGANLMTFTSTNSWKTIGFTADHTNDANPISEAYVGRLVDTSTFGVQTVGENDIIAGSVAPISNNAARVGRVNFGCNYSWNTDRFEYEVFEDGEIENLSPFGELKPYEINSKGLIKAFQGGSYTGPGRRSPWDVFLPPDTGCEGVYAPADSSHGINASDSFPTLFCEHLFDRYRHPPLRFKCKLKWKFNTLEVGDNVRVTHDVDGVLLDYEQGTATVTDRVFEVVAIRPLLNECSVEVELLGHRLGE